MCCSINESMDLFVIHLFTWCLCVEVERGKHLHGVLKDKQKMAVWKARSPLVLYKQLAHQSCLSLEQKNKEWCGLENKTEVCVNSPWFYDIAQWQLPICFTDKMWKHWKFFFLCFFYWFYWAIHFSLFPYLHLPYTSVFSHAPHVFNWLSRYCPSLHLM